MTKSLPNIIKSNCVFISDSGFKVIDSNDRDDFFPISFKQVVEINSEEEQSADGNITNEEELFQMNTHKNASDKLQEMQSFTEAMLEDAKKEAERLKSEAISNAQEEINLLKEQAVNTGYSEGLEKGEQEIVQKLAQLEQREQELLASYNDQLEEMQGNVTNLLIHLVQKITGVVIEEKSIISYLVCDAVKAQSACNEFRISVSKVDFKEVNHRIDEIKDLVRSTAQITIIENPELSKNQCKIETEKNIIDCSIETKLTNLIMALKLLT